MSNIISKDEVKIYLDGDGSDKLDELKNIIDNGTDFKEFKKKFTVLLVKYFNNDSKIELDDFISNNFTNKKSDAKYIVGKILKDLSLKIKINDGNSEKNSSNNSQKDDGDIKTEFEFYHKYGLSSPGEIRENVNESMEAEEEKEMQKFYSSISPIGKKLKNKILSILGPIYGKATADIIHAPGNVSPKMLAENKEKLNDASVKLDNLIEQLESDLDEVKNINIQDYDKLGNSSKDINDVKDIYDRISLDNFNENDLNEIEGKLGNISKSNIAEIRNSLEDLQKSRLEKALRELATDTEYGDLDEKELNDEIEYAMLDCKVEDNGELVLPEHSIFKEILEASDSTIPEIISVKEMLRKYSGVIKVEEMSDEELLNVVEKIHNIDELNSDSKEYEFAKEIIESEELLPEDYDDIISNVYEISENQNIIESFSQEIEIRHKLLISNEIKDQFSIIKGIINKYEEKEKLGSLSRKDRKEQSKTSKVARRMAENLVKTRGKKGILTTIDEGAKKSSDVLKDAEDVLISDLDEARNKGDKLLRKNKLKDKDNERE